MKKLTKILICLILCVFAFGLAACAKKPIMHPDSAAAISGNGGLAVRKGEYLYFVNGYMSADDMSHRDATYTLGAIYVTKLDESGNPVTKEDGSLDAGSYARLSSRLSGFEATSLNIYGDYLYFTSPCQENENKVWQKQRVLFFRIKLDGTKGAEKLYQSTANNRDLEYAYYFNGSNVSLAVYEKTGQKLVVVNASNKKKTTVSDINNCAMPTNNGGAIMYVKSVERDEQQKYEVCKIDLSTAESKSLATLDEAVTVKFSTPEYFFFEQSDGAMDNDLYYLPITATTLETKSICWESVNNFSSYTISQDGKTLIALRDSDILYKYNWQINPKAAHKTFAAGSDSVNILGTTSSNLVYYELDTTDSDNEKFVFKTFNFSSESPKIRTIASVSGLDKDEIEDNKSYLNCYFDVDEDYIYFYKTIGSHPYLHRLQLSNNEERFAEEFVGVYLQEDVPETEESEN